MSRIIFTVNLWDYRSHLKSGQTMRALLFVMALVVSAAVAADKPFVECTENLGFGFRRVVIAEPAPPNAKVFEAIGHFEYLFYRDQKLGRFG